MGGLRRKARERDWMLQIQTNEKIMASLFELQDRWMTFFFIHGLP
jgi:hypothetical protein